MSTHSVEKPFLIERSPFALTQRDVIFARNEAVRTLEEAEIPAFWIWRTYDLFTTQSDKKILHEAESTYAMIHDLERIGVPPEQITQALLRNNPAINDYAVLFSRSPWGGRLSKALTTENYNAEDQKPALWNDFVLERIYTTLGGSMLKQSDYLLLIGDISFQFASNNFLRIQGNVNFKNYTNPRRVGTDDNYDLSFYNLSSVSLQERSARVVFNKSVEGLEIGLSVMRTSKDDYRLQLIV